MATGADKELMGRFCIQDRGTDGARLCQKDGKGCRALNFQKLPYKSKGRSASVDSIFTDDFTEMSDNEVVVGENLARQHKLVVCKMTSELVRCAAGVTEGLLGGYGNLAALNTFRLATVLDRLTGIGWMIDRNHHGP